MEKKTVYQLEYNSFMSVYLCDRGVDALVGLMDAMREGRLNPDDLPKTMTLGFEYDRMRVRLLEGGEVDSLSTFAMDRIGHTRAYFTIPTRKDAGTGVGVRVLVSKSGDRSHGVEVCSAKSREVGNIWDGVNLSREFAELMAKGPVVFREGDTIREFVLGKRSQFPQAVVLPEGGEVIRENIRKTFDPTPGEYRFYAKDGQRITF
jgi:hypothetical protein